MRPYERDKDHDVLKSLLSGEGYSLEEMGFSRYETWVLDEDGVVKGFFTLRRIVGLPYVEHFCVAPTFRAGPGAETPYVGWRMLRELKKLLTARGARAAILNSKNDDPFVSRIIGTVFKAEPYAHAEGLSFFLTEAIHV
jgi:hypothetical protein